MKTSVSLCLLAAASSLLVACNSNTQAADVQSLSANEVQWNKDLAAKDTARIVNHYADDAVLMIAGQPPALAHDALTKAFEAANTDPAFSLKFHANKIEVAKSGDIGFVQGAYEMTFTDPSKQIVHDHGSYLTTYRKAADGSWKAVDDVANSEVPPAPPAK